jgi:hypothetical protein
LILCPFEANKLQYRSKSLLPIDDPVLLYVVLGLRDLNVYLGYWNVDQNGLY